MAMKPKEIDIEGKSKELKEFISQFDTQSFLTQFCYITNILYRQRITPLNIKSPLRQLSYLISLFFNTENSNGKQFDPLDKEIIKKIEILLEEIETGYRYNYYDNINRDSFDEEYFKKFEIASPTYLNYFVNGTLNFSEQEIDRIWRVFKPFEAYINSETGLELKDYVDFFEITEYFEIAKIKDFFEKINTKENLEFINKFQKDRSSLKLGEFEKIHTHVEDAINGLRIGKSELVYYFSDEKIERLISIFSIIRQRNDSYLFYTQECDLLKRPVLAFPDGSILFLFQKQLIHAIYDYLFKLCINIDKHGTKIHRQKENQLEEKTIEVLKDFFGNNVKVYQNYYINGSEKDILVLCRNTAFILECKANRYREPLFNVEQAYTRIKDDFEKCIQKGYDQAFEVKDYFLSRDLLTIRNDKGGIVDIISTKKYPKVYSIIVTHERFGQIQCDLGLLLKKNDFDEFPWSVCIDDLETFLITLKRKGNYLGEFITFLHNRAKLHKRLFCFDELELATLFIMAKDEYIKSCNRKEYFLSSPDLHLLFDELYNVGFGFKNERRLELKLANENIITTELTKKLKLHTPDAIKQFKMGFKCIN